MRHASCARHLSQYVDDTLDPKTRRAVESHVERCAACRAEVAELRAMVDLLGDLSYGVEVPGRLADRVLARVRAGEADPRWWDRFATFARAPLHASFGPPLATAALGVGLLVVLQGVEIEVSIPGLGSEIGVVAGAVPTAPPAQVADATAPALAPVQNARTPLASRRRHEPLPVMPPLSTCVGRPAAPECARWNAWWVGLGMRDPRHFVREVESVPAPSRAQWLGELSRFAAHSGSASVLAAKLRESGDPGARRVATHFERTAAIGDR